MSFNKGKLQSSVSSTEPFLHIFLDHKCIHLSLSHLNAMLERVHQWFVSPREAKSAWTSGSRWRASISSICTRRCSECSDRPDLFDLLDFVDLEDLALFVLFARERVDCLCNKLWLIVRCRFLLLELAAMLTIHWCLTASSALILSVGDITRHLSIKFFARSDTSFQCWKIKIVYEVLNNTCLHRNVSIRIEAI